MPIIKLKPTDKQIILEAYKRRLSVTATTDILDINISVSTIRYQYSLLKAEGIKQYSSQQLFQAKIDNES